VELALTSRASVSGTSMVELGIFASSPAGVFHFK
jgi:hypothetical protein